MDSFVLVGHGYEMPFLRVSPPRLQGIHSTFSATRIHGDYTPISQTLMAPGHCYYVDMGLTTLILHILMNTTLLQVDHLLFHLCHKRSRE